MSGPLLLPTWEQLEATHPQVVATMRTYLAQVACVLRPGSVAGADLALRSFTAYLAADHLGLQHVRDIDRPHIEGFKPWLAARPGQNKARVTPATIAHRLGTLRVFFTRIDEWGWDDAPPRVPMFLGESLASNTPCPKPSTTRRQPSCCAPRKPTAACSSASPSSSSSAPASASGSTPPWPPTPSS